MLKIFKPKTKLLGRLLAGGAVLAVLSGCAVGPDGYYGAPYGGDYATYPYYGYGPGYYGYGPGYYGYGSTVFIGGRGHGGFYGHSGYYDHPGGFRGPGGGFHGGPGGFHGGGFHGGGFHH